MTQGISYSDALAAYAPCELREPAVDDITTEALLRAFHPDHIAGSMTQLRIGANAGDTCHTELAQLLLELAQGHRLGRL